LATEGLSSTESERAVAEDFVAEADRHPVFELSPVPADPAS